MPTSFYYYVRKKVLKDAPVKRKYFRLKDFTIKAKILFLFILLATFLTTISPLFLASDFIPYFGITAMILMLLVVIFISINEATIYKTASLIQADEENLNAIVDEISNVREILETISNECSSLFPSNNISFWLDQLIEEATLKIAVGEKKYTNFFNVVLSSILIPIFFTILNWSIGESVPTGKGIAIILGVLFILSLILFCSWIYYQSSFFSDYAADKKFLILLKQVRYSYSK